MREEALELVIELGGEGLVVGHHQRGAVRLLDDLRHGVGLAGSSNAQQHLVLLTVEHTSYQGLNRIALVTFRLVVADESEIHERRPSLHGTETNSGGWESFYYNEASKTVSWAQRETRATLNWRTPRPLA